MFKRIGSLLVILVLTTFFCTSLRSEDQKFPGKFFYTYQGQRRPVEDAIKLLPKSKHKPYSEMLADLYSKMEADPTDQNSQAGAYVIYNVMKKDLDDDQKIEWASQLASVMSDKLLSAKLFYESGDPARAYVTIETGLQSSPNDEDLLFAKALVAKDLLKPKKAMEIINNLLGKDISSGLRSSLNNLLNSL